MGSWRRQRGEIRHQDVKGTGLQSRKPPLDNEHCDVPLWEKKFCSSVGTIPWRKFLETKKYVYLYDNVLKWNDSAGEEAFNNAKSRFWAQINDLHCNISLPDPDIYIDKIDWNSSIDPDLLLDLEREPEAPIAEEGDRVIIGLHDTLRLDPTVWSTGWGEAEEDFQKSNGVSFGRECNNCDQNVDDGGNSWEEMNYPPSDGALREKECGQYLNNPVGWNHEENSHNELDKGFSYETSGQTWDAKGKMGGNQCHSTFKTLRFHGDGYRKENNWQNRRGRRWYQKVVSYDRVLCQRDA